MASVATLHAVDDVASQAHERAVLAIKIQMHRSNGEAFLNSAFVIRILVASILSRERADYRTEENRSHEEADKCSDTSHALHLETPSSGFLSKFVRTVPGLTDVNHISRRVACHF